MRKNIYSRLIVLATTAILTSASFAADVQPSKSAVDDAIGGLIRDLRTKQNTQAQQPVVVAKVSLSPAKPSVSNANADADLAARYSSFARAMIRAAWVSRPDIFQQGRARVEEFLKGVVTQASFETGRFSSGLAREACNFWGMKDRSDVGADKMFYKGEYYEKFQSVYEGCVGYMKVICRDRYRGFEQCMADKRAYIAHLAKSGWCPDSDYVDQAMSVYDGDKQLIDQAVTSAAEELYHPTQTTN